MFESVSSVLSVSDVVCRGTALVLAGRIKPSIVRTCSQMVNFIRESIELCS